MKRGVVTLDNYKILVVLFGVCLRVCKQELFLEQIGDKMMELELMPYLENGWCCVKENVKKNFGAK